MKRSWVSAITSKGPRPISTPPVGPKLNAQDFSKNLPSWAASPGVTLAGTSTKVARDVVVPVDADQVAHVGREPDPRKEEALAAFEPPVVVVAEVHQERHVPAPAVPMFDRAPTNSGR